MLKFQKWLTQGFVLLVMGCAPFVLKASWMEDHGAPSNLQTMIQRGLKNFESLKERQKTAISANGEKGELETTAKVFLQQKKIQAKGQEEVFSVLLVHTFDGTYGALDIFKGNDFSSIDESFYRGRGTCEPEGDLHLSTLAYQLRPSYTALQEQVLYASVGCLRTNPEYQNRGFATFIIGEFLDFVFLNTAAEFSIAYVSNEKEFAKRAFKRQDFQITSGDVQVPTISLDGGAHSTSLQVYEGTGGNFYCSRFTWQQRQE